MRFNYGTVGNLNIPPNRDLTDIEAGTTPLFRVKVVDKSAQQGKIIAMADKIHPKGIENANRDNINLGAVPDN